jgi:ribosomal-protein-alanine N-acetyltransferase
MKKLKRTKRLCIRPMDQKDYLAWKAAYEGMLSPQNMWDRSHRKTEVTRKTFQTILRKQKPRAASDLTYSYGIFLNKTGELIGEVMVMDIVRGITHSAYLGYVLFNQYWGKGFATEAVRAMLDIAFRELKLHRIEAGVEPKNKRSIKLAQTLGFRREGIKKKMVFLRGKWVDLVVFGMTCEEFGVKWKGTIVRQY